MMSLAESERPFCEVRFSVGRFRGPAVLCCRLDEIALCQDSFPYSVGAWIARGPPRLQWRWDLALHSLGCLVPGTGRACDRWGRAEVC